MTTATETRWMRVHLIDIDVCVDAARPQESITESINKYMDSVAPGSLAYSPEFAPDRRAPRVARWTEIAMEQYDKDMAYEAEREARAAAKREARAAAKPAPGMAICPECGSYETDCECGLGL
jgi:hypothetical protein